MPDKILIQAITNNLLVEEVWEIQGQDGKSETDKAPNPV